METAPWTYELPPTGAASEGLGDYEARTPDADHIGVVVGTVRRAAETFLIVDAGAMPPFVHRRIAIPWRLVADVDHAALVVRLSVDREALEDHALALDSRKAVHGAGAEAVKAALPAELTRPVVSDEGPAEHYSVVLLAALAASAPFSLFVLITIWMTRGLEGWEYSLLAIPFVLAALTVALEGYRLFREPHLGRGPRTSGREPRSGPRDDRAHLGFWQRVDHRLGGKSALVLFAVGGGIAYLATVLGVTVALGNGLPVLGWIGFAVATTVVLVASTVLAVFLVRSSTGAGSEAPRLHVAGPDGVHRVLVVADEGCSGDALCEPLAGRMKGLNPEVLVVAPELVSGLRYLDSDVDAARRDAEARIAETVGAFTAAGIRAHGEVGSESPLEAIADALSVFRADEIVLATPPAERANWLEQGVVERARELYAQPVSHLVVETPLVDVRP